MSIEDPKRKNAESPGNLRPNQLITTFGPGSIAQMKNDSVIVMGIDWWDTSDKFTVVQHPSLEKICNKSHFRMPIAMESTNKVIPCKSFPTWGVCSNTYCRRLQQHKSSPHPNNNSQFLCSECKNQLLPARMIIMCDKGHLDEFPWVKWAHSSPKDSALQCTAINPKLKWSALNKTTSIGDYYVKCLDCGSSRKMSGALGPQGLPSDMMVCFGYSPWLGKHEKCTVRSKKNNTLTNSSVRAVLTRATSLYYPSTISALLIPKYRHPIQIRINEKIETIRDDIDDSRSFEEIAKRKIFEELRDEQNYSVNEIVDKLEIRFGEGGQINKDSTESDIKDEEYEDIMETEFEGDDIIDVKSAPLGELEKYFSVLKKANRLTMVKVLRYFTRGSPPNPYASDEEDDMNICSIQRRKQDWFPCVSNKGEGIFFSIREDLLKEWEQRPEVQKRCGALFESFNEWAKTREWDIPETRRPRYVLLHTLAHVLIRELSISSGYNEASIAERIYEGNNHNAILLFTASSSSDGSLGGLVRKAEQGQFLSILENAIQKSKYCSRDPLCIEDDPYEKKQRGFPVHTRLNGAACYACTLIPETSCNEFNRLLDRKFLFDDEVGFFRDI